MSVESLLAQFDQEDAAAERGALSRAAIVAHNVNPDKHAVNLRKAKKAGTPKAFVPDATRPANEDDLHALLQDFHRLPLTAPKTATFLSNQDNAKLAHDDHPVLSKLEGLFNIFKGATARVAQGVNTSLAGVNEAFGLQSDVYREGEAYWNKVAERSGSKGLAAKVYEGIGGAPVGIAEYLGNVPYAATKGAVQGYRKGGVPGLVEGALTETVKRYGIGKVFKGIENSGLSATGKSLTMAGTMGAQTAAEGGNVQDVVASTLTGLALMPPSAGGKGDAVRAHLLKAGVAPEIAHDIAAHVDGVTAHANAENIQDIVDSAKESKLAGRSPEDFKGFLKSAAKEAPPVTMQVEKFDELLTTKGLKPEDVLEDPAQYYEAKAEGGKVEIPAADLAGMAQHVTSEHIKEMGVDGVPSVKDVEERLAEEPKREGAKETTGEPSAGDGAEQRPAAVIRPAVKWGDEILTGDDGHRHADIVPGAPENTRGFLTPDGKFIKRKAAADWLRDNRADLYGKLSDQAKKQLHSEDLWGALGVDFVRTPEGDVDFGEFTPESGVMAGGPAPVRLLKGNADEGLLSIKKQGLTKGAGHDTVESFVGDVVKNHTQVYEGEGGTLLLVKKAEQGKEGKGRGKGGQLHQVELEPSSEGTFYKVKSAETTMQFALKDKKLLWEREQPKPPVESDGAALSEPATGGEPAPDETINLYAGVPIQEGVRAVMHLAGEIRNSKAGRQVEKLMTPGLEAGEKSRQGIASLLIPTAKSPEHLAAAELLGAKLGKMHRNQEMAADQLRKDGLMFDKMGVHNEQTPLAENTGIQFMSDMSQGRQMEPKLQAVADRVTALFEDRLAQLEEADVPVETTRENYFPGMWTNDSRKAFNLAIGGAIERGIGGGKPLNEWAAEEKAYVHDRVKALMESGKGSAKEGLQYLARIPFKGKESFRKAKVFDDIMTAVEFGLEPISPNPIDLVKLKLAEMDRSIMANSALQEWRELGDEKFLRVGQQVPEGWVKVNDKYGTVYGPRDMAGEDVYIGRPILGYRIVKEPVADVLNNYLSASLYNNRYFGTLYKGYMGMANALNQSQLGVGSAFHVGFTEAEVVISGGANLIKDLYGVATGTRTVKQLAKTAAHMPTAFIKTPMEGDAILKEWRNPGSSMNPRVQQVVKAAELAGGGFKLEQGLRTDQTAKMVQDWYSDHKVRAALRSPVAAVELMAKPIMDWLVPRQKAGVFGHLAWRIIEQNPGKALKDLTPEFRQAWNRVDARLGQVRYDRLFMNNAAKNAVQGLVRAPGWSGGTIAEIGGSLKDTVSFLKAWAETGTAPNELPDRVAYTLSLVATGTALSGLLTYAFTGEQPTGMDFWAFRTGGTDEYGRPERFLLPTYLKDVYAYTEDPGKTLLAKTHPVISIIGDLLRNKDYYGVTIANEDDNQVLKAIERGEYVLKAFVPFWIRGAQKEAERGGGLMETLTEHPEKILAPQLGIMPATSDYTKSAAEKQLSKFIGEQMPQGGRTQEEADTSKARREIIRALRGGATIDSLPPQLQQHLETLTERQVTAIEKEAELTPLQASFQHLQDPNLEKSLKVWAKATDAERDELRDLYETRINKYFLSHELEQSEIDKLEERIQDAEERKH